MHFHWGSPLCIQSVYINYFLLLDHLAGSMVRKWQNVMWFESGCKTWFERDMVRTQFEDMVRISFFMRIWFESKSKNEDMVRTAYCNFKDLSPHWVSMPDIIQVHHIYKTLLWSKRLEGWLHEKHTLKNRLNWLCLGGTSKMRAKPLMYSICQYVNGFWASKTMEQLGH